MVQISAVCCSSRISSTLKETVLYHLHIIPVCVAYCLFMVYFKVYFVDILGTWVLVKGVE
jgi:hypothetical protein